MATPEREDFLNEDPEIPGQKVVLLSFLSPEKVLAKKDLFYFESFLKQFEFNFRIRNLEEFLVKTMTTINKKLDDKAIEFDKQDLSGCADLCRSSKLRVDTTMESLQEFVKGNLKEMKETKLKDNFDDYVFANKTKLEEEFFALNNFQTSVRGLKVRGVYSSQAEAEARSKKLQRVDQIHNIFLGEIGKWLPWDPAPSDVANQEYAEEQLNTLMKKYKENEEAREEFMKENRNRPRTEKGNVTVTNAAAPSNAASAEAGSGFNAMFDGPADLAMQRKMENKLE
jgi:hypothetical protein